MALDITYAEGNNVTVTATETSLAVDGGSTTLQTLTDVGYYTFVLDLANLVKADEYTLRVKEKAQASGTQRLLFDPIPIRNAHTSLWMMPNLYLGVGWDITLQRVSATSRAFFWTVRRSS